MMIERNAEGDGLMLILGLSTPPDIGVLAALKNKTKIASRLGT